MPRPDTLARQTFFRCFATLLRLAVAGYRLLSRIARNMASMLSERGRRLNIMYRVEHETAAFAEDVDSFADLAIDFVRSSERQGVLGIAPPPQKTIFGRIPV